MLIIRPLENGKPTLTNVRTSVAGIGFFLWAPAQAFAMIIVGVRKTQKENSLKK